MTRLERHRQIVALREAGLAMNEIARYLKLSKSSVYDYYTDPDGDKAQERRHRRHGICLDCGAKTFNGGSVEVPKRCRPCQKVYAGTLEARRRTFGPGRLRWSDEEILAALRRVSDDGFLTGPMYDEAYNRAPRGSMPSKPLIVARFEFWSRAVQEAGLHGLDERSGPYAGRLTEEGAICAALDCTVAIGRLPSYRDYSDWARTTGSPSATLVRNRCGSWGAVVEACAAELGLAA